MSDMHEPTAWEDINPPMVSVRQPAPPSRCSDHLAPADNETFGIELTACLALVVPVGMDEAARREWLAVAWGTLKDLPADLLRRGCQAARKTCDHPAKIVPAIMAEVEDVLKQRRQSHNDKLSLPAPLKKRNVMDRRGEPMSQEDTDELNDILESLGALARYRPDGSKYSIAG